MFSPDFLQFLSDLIHHSPYHQQKACSTRRSPSYPDSREWQYSPDPFASAIASFASNTHLPGNSLSKNPSSSFLLSLYDATVNSLSKELVSKLSISLLSVISASRSKCLSLFKVKPFFWKYFFSFVRIRYSGKEIVKILSYINFVDSVFMKWLAHLI